MVPGKNRLAVAFIGGEKPAIFLLINKKPQDPQRIGAVHRPIENRIRLILLGGVAYCVQRKQR